ncbi:hypothetical protein [Cronobacter dublinensis]|uniref:hypothetical protein n=1 Tax=Cronobacter dublinensis TaxID=413497 RepID=UPI000CFC7DD3|nr:hypothetical protein [Cronobacter dublinensis]
MDKSREKFEEAFEEITGWEAEDYPNEDYVDTLWRIWQASRAAAEVEIPEVLDYWLGREGFAESIRAAGLKVKGE